MKWLKLMCVGFALAGVLATASADEQEAPGRQIFRHRCQGCHNDSSVGPKLNGIWGTRGGSGSPGVHSRAAIESGIVWERESLRLFLLDPQRVIPGTFMSTGLKDPAEVEQLLDYIETLR